MQSKLVLGLTLVALRFRNSHRSLKQSVLKVDVAIYMQFPGFNACSPLGCVSICGGLSRRDATEGKDGAP